MRIAFTHNLQMSQDEEHAEFDTAATIEAISEALRSLGHEVYPVEVSGPASRLVARLETLRPELVFNTAEGTRGRYREAFYPALFEQLDLPFTGSDAYVCGLTLDKQMTKLLARQAGVPTPAWAFFDAENPLTDTLPELRYPVIVKPNFEGSSKGITQDSIARTPERLREVLAPMIAKYPAGVLVEEFIVGQDVTVPFLEKVGVLSPAAYRMEGIDTAPGWGIYDYALKNEHSDRVHIEIPAPVSDELHQKLVEMTRRVMRGLEIRDLGRADFRVTPDGELFFIEVNALPSLEPGASIYESAKLAGLARVQDVLEAVVQSAIERQNIKTRKPRTPDTLVVGLTYNVRRVDPRSGDDRDAEFDSQDTINAISKAIESFGHEVVLLEATRELPRQLGDVDLDIVFNIAEGFAGRSREAQVPALLELLGIPYTGSDPAALAITLDKGLAKRIVREAGVATARAVMLSSTDPIPPQLRYPVIVKPNLEGSSKGVTRTSVARDRAELSELLTTLRKKFSSPMLLEEFLPGREFTVGVLGDISPRVLPPMEVVFDESCGDLPIYSYEHKTGEDTSATFEVPAKLDESLREKLHKAALDCFAALGCRDVARIDFRLDADGEPNFIECNPLPGLSPGYSDLCVIAQSVGMDHATLVGAILAPAVRRMKNSREER
jgi:D-alanine-D-alanine ligase